MLAEGSGAGDEGFALAQGLLQPPLRAGFRFGYELGGRAPAAWKGSGLGRPGTVDRGFPIFLGARYVPEGVDRIARGVEIDDAHGEDFDAELSGIEGAWHSGWRAIGPRDVSRHRAGGAVG